MNRYSSEIAQLLANKGRVSKSWPAFIWNVVANPAATFLYNYFFRLGFLDGREGLILHMNHSVYIHWKFIKAWRIGQERVKLPTVCQGWISTYTGVSSAAESQRVP